MRTCCGPLRQVAWRPTMSKTYPEQYHEFQLTLGKLANSPLGPTLDGFSRMHQPALAAGAIDERGKRLIAIAIAVATQCDDCIGYYVHEALRAGASDHEVLDAAGVAVMMGGGPAVVYACHVYEALEQFSAAAAESPVPPDAVLAGTATVDDPD
ncbi:carboxymuconolactone decarboxylase family protein [Burkholderia thailandensis]|uniref:carboxymuconolactone decarboxylase family protein n=2 Tax=Burkholderia thailandensis TaxID=57975 RepID=UPI0028C4CBF1|nr:carboxymuconolactone decarboxylase family protein [Burkholderia thailandensis]